MPTTVSGATGVSQVQDGTIQTADIVDGAVTASKLSGGQTGNAPIYSARAWCVFNGTLIGTNAPIAGGNVTNVTRNSAGDYTVTFLTAMPDSNFSATGNAGVSTGGFGNRASANRRTTTTVRVTTVNGSNVLTDFDLVDVQVFR